MEKHEMLQLDWDTNFFKKNVYRVVSSSYSEINKLLRQTTRPSLVYIYSDLEVPEYHEYLMDTKVTFELALSNFKNFLSSNSIVFASKSCLNTITLESLAILSSAQSRFRKDPSILSTVTDDLYRLWLHKAIENPASHEIIAKAVENDIVGMLTMSFVHQQAKIELVAVDPKYQNKGMASDLMQACLNFSQKSGFKTIQVTTQLENKSACRLYQKYGFQIVEKKYIYHIHLS